MNASQLQILNKAKKFATEILLKKVKPLFVFHNLEHTKKVVKAADNIARYYHINDNDHFVLLLAAWFHDTGFSTGQIEEHEKESIRIAGNFLQTYTEPEIITGVSSCIRATHMPQSPRDLIEKIICDADLYHLGTIEFRKLNDRLKQEQQNYFIKNFSREEWCRNNIEFLKSHRYFTGYCRQKLEPVKQRWLKKFEKLNHYNGLTNVARASFSPEDK